jgi:hypothetical protein
MRHPTARGFAAKCILCDGAVVDKAALRQAAGPHDVERIWKRIHRGRPAAVECPLCGKRMESAVVGGVELDGCPDEEVVWFDAAELTPFLTGLAPAERSRLVHFIADIFG